MNQLNEFLYQLLNVSGATYGAIFVIIILAILVIFTFAIILSPLFIWGIHNQTTRTAKELIKLNKKFESWKPQQPLKDRPTDQSSTEQPQQDGQPKQISRRRKVFHKAESDPQNHKEKSI